MTDEVASGRGWMGGHPKGLAYLAFTELWERFSYYGMAALLSLYLVKQLLMPGHAEHVLGLETLRGVFEFRGPISDAAFASLIYGWYGGLVYFTPILGGMIADRWLGAKRTVVAGALLMSAGHLAMSFDSSFLIALLLLILGSGCLKGNISAQVGTLYPQAAESLRERGFTIFSTGINIGSVLGPLATGTVAAVWGWHAGFGLAAVLMLLALVIYLAGQRHLPERRPQRREVRTAMPPLTREEKARSWALIGLIALTVPGVLAYSMIWNIGIVWIDQKVDLASPFGAVPASWFNSVDSFASIVVAAPLIALWAWQARRGREPGSVTKMAIGAALTGLSALALALGSVLAGADGRVSVLWVLAGFVGMGVAFMWYWPILLALVSRSAPAKLNATLMGGAFLALFAGTTAMGWVGSFYDQMSNVAFWTLDAAIALGGAAVIFAVRGPLQQVLEGGD
ncbi:peptide MFS transporter [Sphingomonas sp. G-3-2-10]|uniref:peptide MFS transporter n=1 Tax=Sphingomonas sp. G-3-2-10 TaxID=2728838 RepID=UPI00146DD913|nr:peptide MFS transporter [Sphingomonas sp. G-3-2-10]NML04199.1 peptide MFS transporter [Sphingomonas sp. G-3-2-10]